MLLLVDLSAQSIDSLKLTKNDLPKEYSFTNTSNCISIQACIFYDKPEIYESIIGKIKRKDVQNFESKKDNGSIMYFEFEKDFEQTGFLEGLLWGGDKPTKEHPEKYKVYKNILIIWSFNNGSPLEKISENKIKKLLN
jgi:hypothetical protein